MEAARSPETVESPSLIIEQPTPEDNILSWSWRHYNYVLQSAICQIKSDEGSSAFFRNSGNYHITKRHIAWREGPISLFLKLQEICIPNHVRGPQSSQRGTKSSGRRNQWDTPTWRAQKCQGQ
jgi:hypothetical protein